MCKIACNAVYISVCISRHVRRTVNPLIRGELEETLPAIVLA